MPGTPSLLPPLLALLCLGVADPNADPDEPWCPYKELPDVKTSCINNEPCITLALNLINLEDNEKKWKFHKYLMIRDLA
ncbi:hypothetical protein TURU_164573 [Turdus rufiventris]|nr:hypothetical protein TURU_164573 [Turdus rufiventris]